MWREYGLPAKHPAFCLVLHNYNIRCQLQGQGRIVINTSDLDLNTTAHDISLILNNDTQKKCSWNKEDVQKTLHPLR